MLYLVYKNEFKETEVAIKFFNKELFQVFAAFK